MKIWAKLNQASSPSIKKKFMVIFNCLSLRSHCPELPQTDWHQAVTKLPFTIFLGFVHFFRCWVCFLCVVSSFLDHGLLVVELTLQWLLEEDHMGSGILQTPHIWMLTPFSHLVEMWAGYRILSWKMFFQNFEDIKLFYLVSVAYCPWEVQSCSCSISLACHLFFSSLEVFWIFSV